MAALLACQRTRSITSNSDLTAADAERVSGKIRMMLSKLRKLTGPSKFLNAFQMSFWRIFLNSNAFPLVVFLSVCPWSADYKSNAFTYEVRKDFQKCQRDTAELAEVDHGTCEV